MVTKNDHLGEEIYSFVKDLMDDVSHQRARQHVQECSQCSTAVDELTSFLEAMDLVAPSPLAQEDKDRILRRMRGTSIHKPFFERLRESLQAKRTGWAIQGLAVAATVLLALGIIEYSPWRNVNRLDFDITLTEVENPVFIDVEDVEFALDELEKLVESHHGQVLQTIQMDGSMKVTLTMPVPDETALFEELSRLGNIHKKNEGYRDDKGNIVVVLSNQR